MLQASADTYCIGACVLYLQHVILCFLILFNVNVKTKQLFLALDRVWEKLEPLLAFYYFSQLHCRDFAIVTAIPARMIKPSTTATQTQMKEYRKLGV